MRQMVPRRSPDLRYSAAARSEIQNISRQKPVPRRKRKESRKIEPRHFLILLFSLISSIKQLVIIFFAREKGNYQETT